MSTVVQTQPGMQVYIASRHCPNCSSVRVHRSKRRGFTDSLFATLGAVIRRCHDCGERQAWFEWRGIRKVGISVGKLDSVRHRHLGVAVAGGAGFCVAALVWHWLKASHL